MGAQGKRCWEYKEKEKKRERKGKGKGNDFFLIQISKYLIHSKVIYLHFLFVDQKACTDT